MRLMERNKQTFYYQTYEGETELVDEDGLDTGRTVAKYSDKTECRGTISVASGYAEQQVFGNLEQYDRVIILDDKTVPIDETSRVYIDDKSYIVKRVADSLNFKYIAISRVNDEEDSDRSVETVND